MQGCGEIKGARGSSSSSQPEPRGKVPARHRRQRVCCTSYWAERRFSPCLYLDYFVSGETQATRQLFLICDGLLAVKIHCGSNGQNYAFGFLFIALAYSQEEATGWGPWRNPLPLDHVLCCGVWTAPALQPGNSAYRARLILCHDGLSFALPNPRSGRCGGGVAARNKISRLPPCRTSKEGGKESSTRIRVGTKRPLV